MPQAPKLTRFPKEFERNFLDRLDFRFWSIFAIIFVFAYSTMFYLSSLDYSLSEEEIAKIREAYIKKIYEVELVTTQEVDVNVDEGTGSALVTEEAQPKTEEGKEVAEQMSEVRQESAAERRERRLRQARARSARKEAKVREVSGKGVLGVLTAGGGGGVGSALEDVFAGGAGGTGGVGDIDEVIQDVGGIAVASSSGETTRRVKGGGRGGSAAAGATIDEFVEGTGVSGGVSLSRQGKISLSGPARVTGRARRAANRNADVITRVINAHSGAIEHCYSRELKVNPNLKGEVVVEFTISPDGHVTRARVLSSTLNNSRVERCIINNVRRWRDFPKIDKSMGDVTIRQKYIFG
ncbi:MAG: hypothetical protein Kow00108_08940 [Calditrichia bacterium]